MSFLPDYKEITELIKKGLTLEAQEKIMELRVGALALQEENLKLREQVRQLEAELSLARDFTFDEEFGVYWHTKPDGSREGPFCAVCHDEHKRLSRLHDGRKRQIQARWFCLICNNAFE